MKTSPSPSEIIEARKNAGLTQTEAARLIWAGLRTWQNWEAGCRSMHPALFELWRIKAELKDDAITGTDRAVTMLGVMQKQIKRDAERYPALAALIKSLE